MAVSKSFACVAAVLLVLAAVDARSLLQVRAPAVAPAAAARAPTTAAAARAPAAAPRAAAAPTSGLRPAGSATSFAPTVLDAVAENAATFSTLLYAIEQANLLETLSNPNLRVTVLAPTDRAFADRIGSFIRANNIQPQQFLSNTNALATILQFHVIAQPLLPAQFTNGARLATLLGPQLTVSRTAAGSVSVAGPLNSAQLGNVNGTSYITSGQSYIYAIDDVLIPEGLDLGFGPVTSASLPAKST